MYFTCFPIFTINTFCLIFILHSMAKCATYFYSRIQLKQDQCYHFKCGNYHLLKEIILFLRFSYDENIKLLPYFYSLMTSNYILIKVNPLETYCDYVCLCANISIIDFNTLSLLDIMLMLAMLMA